MTTGTIILAVTVVSGVPATCPGKFMLSHHPDKGTMSSNSKTEVHLKRIRNLHDTTDRAPVLYAVIQTSSLSLAQKSPSDYA